MQNGRETGLSQTEHKRIISAEYLRHPMEYPPLIVQRSVLTMEAMGTRKRFAMYVSARARDVFPFYSCIYCRLLKESIYAFDFAALPCMVTRLVFS